MAYQVLHDLALCYLLASSTLLYLLLILLQPHCLSCFSLNIFLEQSHLRDLVHFVLPFFFAMHAF